MLKLLPYLALFFLVSCASSPKHELDDYADKAIPFLGDQFEIYDMGSDGAIADATFITVSKTSGPSHQSILLAQKLNSSIDEPYKVAIAGENYSKNAVIVRSALKEMVAGSGANSSLVCFCSDSYRSSILEAAKQAGVTVHYVVD